MGWIYTEVQYVMLLEFIERSALAFEMTIPSLISFTVCVVLLVTYAILDLRNRKVPNQLMIIGGFCGLLVVIFTGHLLNNPWLHASAFAFTVLFSLLLYRIGAIGGADFKVLIIIAVTSPGVSFTSWTEPIYEGIIASGLEIAIMLLLGLIYSKSSKRKKSSEESSVVPLLPLLLLAYLGVQLLALV
jgi:Flp pilus assembly protein protease CpaA